MSKLNSISKTFVIYGIFLWVVGILGYASNPEKAATALASGGLFGSLAIVLGVLYHRGAAWALTAGKACVVFLSIVFVWRSSVSWMAVAAGNTDKVIAAGLISSMLLASIISFLRVRKLQS